MTTEAVYGLASAGHANHVKRNIYESAESKLLQRCMQWCDEMKEIGHDVYRLIWEKDKLYGAIPPKLDGLELTVDDIHSTLMHPNLVGHPNYNLLGPLISAAYNIAPDRAITFDIDVPEIDWLGYGLRDKLFINKGIVGKNWGVGGESVLLNLGSLKDWARASYAVINIGEARSFSGSGFLLSDNKIEVDDATSFIERRDGCYMNFHSYAPGGDRRHLDEFSDPVDPKDHAFFDNILRLAKEDPAQLLNISPEEYLRIGQKYPQNKRAIW
jgi:hypothetical protein